MLQLALIGSNMGVYASAYMHMPLLSAATV